MTDRDLTLTLSTPDMNRLRYLVGRDVRSYVPAKRVPSYTGAMPYLIVKDEAAKYPVGPIDPDKVLRSASQEEYDEVVALKQRLDNLWSYGNENAEEMT